METKEFLQAIMCLYNMADKKTKAQTFELTIDMLEPEQLDTIWQFLKAVL